MIGGLFDLHGRVAVITGSSRGIGRAIAEAMAAAGARVVISSRNQGACAAVAAEISAGGGEALAVAANVGDEEALEHLVATTLDTWGAIDILVGNAAVNPYFGPLAAVDPGALDKILRCNLLANLWLVGRVAPTMAARGGGSVIVVSSIGGLRGDRNLGAYNLSKAGELQLVRDLAVEWGGRGVRVNAIAPGLVRTDFARALWEDPRRRAAIEARTPLGRIGEPHEIAGAAVFLAADAASFITGQVIVADGGVTISGPF